MCGIAGFVTTSAGAGSESVLRRMTDRIRHRGPDDYGFYVDDHAFDFVAAWNKVMDLDRYDLARRGETTKAALSN